MADVVRNVKVAQANKWQTLEWFAFNSSTAFFQAPPGATIRVLTGSGWFSYQSWRQVLDGYTFKRLVTSKYSPYSRMQISVPQPTYVQYQIFLGEVLSSPKIPF